MTTNTNRLALSAIAVGLGCAAFAGAARAQTAEQTVDIESVGVRERPRPEYQALGVHVGAFTVFPQVVITPEYDDNIYASQDNPTGDFVTAIAPSVRIQSNWSRHELDAYGRVVTNIFANNSSEGTTNYSVGGHGRLDIRNDSNLEASFNYSHSTEPRTAENTITDARDPVQYDVVSGQFGGSHTFNRLTVSGNVFASRYDYQDTVLFSGAPLSQAYRNETTTGVTGRATYELSPAISVFTNLTYDKRDYDQKPPQTPFDRTSDGVEGTVGVNVELTRLVSGNFQVGYFNRNYNQSGYPQVDGPAVHGRIEYFFSPLTTFTVTADRQVIDAADPSAISFTSSDVGVQVDHELRRNIILSGRAGYQYNDYSGIDRQDSRPSLSVSSTYLLNRHVGLTAAYSYISQDSSGVARDRNFSVNVVSLSIVLQL